MKFTRKSTTNTNLRNLIIKCENTKSKLWKYVAKKLLKKKSRSEINISHLGKYVKNGEIVVVPGVVLSEGYIKDKKFTVAALRFSEKAKEKLKNAGCTVLTIEELVNMYPEGKKIRIIG